jgi:hypothetical protein
VTQVQVWRICGNVHAADKSLAEGHGRVIEIGTNKRLGEVAQNWNLKKYVIENPSQQGEFPRELLASTVEAILGAVWLDSYRDFEKVQKVFKKLCSYRMGRRRWNHVILANFNIPKPPDFLCCHSLHSLHY